MLKYLEKGFKKYFTIFFKGEKTPNPQSWLKSFVKNGKITQSGLEELDNCIDAVLNLGLLCQWKGEIFKFLGDKKQQSNWLQLAATVYNCFWWPEFVGYTLQLNPNQYEDLILRIYYIACTVFNLEYKSNPSAKVSIHHTLYFLGYNYIQGVPRWYDK